MQVPTPGITGEDAVKDYTEFITRFETIPMSRLRISEAENSK
jgi:hypothetical protein